MTTLSVSAFAADFDHMGRELRRIEESGADFLHVDVMDGSFVPLTGLGADWLSGIYKRVTLPIDVHLMTYETARVLPRFLALPLHSLLFHVEAESGTEVVRLLAEIRAHGVRCGLAISPETALSALEPYLPLLDELLIMSTMPGRPGTVFHPEALERVRAVRQMAQAHRPGLVISVDGGLEPETAAQCACCGADKIVIGRAFFASSSPQQIAALIHAGNTTAGNAREKSGAGCPRWQSGQAAQEKTGL